MSDGVAQDLWILSIGIDNNPWGQCQPLIPWDPLGYVSRNLKKKLLFIRIFYRKETLEKENFRQC
jgi:hypothetical protein